MGCSPCSFLCPQCWVLLSGSCGCSCHAGIWILSSLWSCSHLALLQGWDESAEFLASLFLKDIRNVHLSLCFLPGRREEKFLLSHCFRREEKFELVLAQWENLVLILFLCFIPWILFDFLLVCVVVGISQLWAKAFPEECPFQADASVRTVRLKLI